MLVANKDYTVREVKMKCAENYGEEYTYKEIRYILDSFFEFLTEMLENKNEVNISNFAKFTTIMYPSRNGVNQQTKEAFYTEAHSVPKCYFSKSVKNKVRKNLIGSIDSTESDNTMSEE